MEKYEELVEYGAYEAFSKRRWTLNLSPRAGEGRKMTGKLISKEYRKYLRPVPGAALGAEDTAVSESLSL